MNTSDRVSLRAYGGRVIERIVVGAAKGMLLVCTDAELERSASTGRKPVCVGFPETDVVAFGRSAVDFNRGDRVRARALSGSEIELVAVDYSDEGEPLYCSPDEYEAARREGREPEAVGWPAADLLGPVGAQPSGA